jgi:hypothetical protein
MFEKLRLWPTAATLVFLTLLFVGATKIAVVQSEGEERATREASYPMVFRADAPYQFSGLESHAVTQENPTGAKGMGGKGRGNGNGRKGAPAFNNIAPGAIKTLCDIQGPGMVRHLWITVEDRSPEMLRSNIVRIYWDNSPYPSVEAPLGDLFGVAHGRTASFMTPYVGMPEGRSFHCYFPMPFSKRCRITFENDSPKAMPWLFYQVDYTLGDKVSDGWGRFHALFRRESAPIGKDYCLLDTQGTPGVFVGAVIGANPKSPGWWGEGEMKFYIDGDDKYPTVCGTGAEDYLCSGWGMEPHQAIYTGVNYMKTDPKTGWQRFVSFYRIHMHDPILFQHGLRVELQQMGAGQLTEERKRKYPAAGPHIHPNMSNWLFDRCDDYCSVVYWYQKVSAKPMPRLPSRADRIRDIAKQSWE